MAERFDFLVIGSGLAGLTFALKAAEHGTVCVLTKADLTESNTNYAQGGIAAAVGESDSWELHEQDTLTAGDGLCNREAVRFLVQRAPAAIEWLQGLGAKFDSKDGRALALGREGGHSRHRIVHAADRTGFEVEGAVTRTVRANPNITVYENTFATRLILDGGRCVGVTAQVSDAGLRSFIGRATMLATGGCGKVYAHTTNPRVATADGIGLAHDAGASIENMEFMQFHPTALDHPQMNGFLLTEALRGEGATLRNHLGRRFMYDYDDRLELAPRDVVARAIEREMAKLDTWCVYLDCTHLDPKMLESHFPTIWSRLRSLGIELEKDWIPVVPAQHYSCGGVATDLDARTTVPGLYASGEVASTGVHGANRLASNSLLEAIIFSSAAAEAVLREPAAPDQIDAPPQPKCVIESEAIRMRRTLQKTMTQFAGVFRTTAGLREAQNRINALLAEHEALPAAPFSAYAHEAHNLLIAGQYVVEGALARDRNVGLHFNADLAAHSV